MKGLKYQLKNICRDKVCMMTFLLPIIVGGAINLLSGVNFQTIGETAFGVVNNDLSTETLEWLQENGRITLYETLDQLCNAVNDPSTQMIAVLKADDGIKTLVSGDELEVNRIIADTLPKIYDSRTQKPLGKRTIIPASNDNDGLKSLLIVITLVTAMFMGCTFNAMNIISEKEDGVALINMVLPMTRKSYMLQKTILGFVGSAVSTVITALICMTVESAQVGSFLLLIALSAYLSALVGLFIGQLSEGLMTGIVYVKIIMIMFLAPPILFYLTVSADSPLLALTYLVPSSAAFYGLMDLLNGQSKQIWINILFLLAHAAFWSIIYMVTGNRKRKIVL